VTLGLDRLAAANLRLMDGSKPSNEPLRESCRLQPLRGWSHVKHIEEVLAGGS
jgi:hypothetical protein